MDETLELIKQGARIDGKDGVLASLIKQLTEAVLEAEIESHLSTEINNRKNGKSSKTMKSSVGTSQRSAVKLKCSVNFVRQKQLVVPTACAYHFKVFQTVIFQSTKLIAQNLILIVLLASKMSCYHQFPRVLTHPRSSNW